MNGSPYNFSRQGRASNLETSEPIAIIGAACRLPGAPDLEAFARLLDERVDAVTEIPDDRWNKARFFHPERGQRGKAYTFAAGVIGPVDRFDAAFFGISPREAVQIDPQQRLCLELAYEALEDAGLDAGRLAGERVGVFVGGSSWDYLNRNLDDPACTDAYTMTGITLCSLANRVSYAFDLRGPSFTVDTACSSSLVALHQACEAIRTGHLPAALVGGVSLLLAPQGFVGFCAASMLSPQGRCHAFDAAADGYVRAEGGGFVVLKPLGDALAAGDPIRAVIRGTGVNSDGRTTGFSLPNREAQAALLAEVYGRFGLDPDALAYVEAHGTGTPAGDPIEAGALGEVLGARRRAPLPIGSVKTNVGHLEAGSGMAGLLKAMLVAERGIVPASLHLVEPNPNIPFAALNLRLVPEALALPEHDRAGRLVGVNSFGFGGTNAHAVLETAPLPAASPGEPADAPLPPLLLAAQSDGALRTVAAQWRATLAAAGPAQAATLLRGAARHRTQHVRRAAVVAPDSAALDDALVAVAAGRTHPLVAQDSAVQGKVAFAFSGNGSQWAGMAGDALARSPAFARALATVDAALRPWLGWSAAEALATPDEEALTRTDVAQPLLFAIQVALVLALREAGVHADAAMGHSVGEVAAAWAAGALDLDEAARVIVARSQAQQQRHGIGGMGVLGLDAAETAHLLAEEALAPYALEVAASNSARATTIAGTEEGLDALATLAKAHGLRFTRLDLAYAFHSAAMDPIEPLLHESLADLRPLSGHGFVSTVTGGRLDGRAVDAGYWWRNVREPVRFAEAARALVDDGYRIFIEIGPHPVLRAYLGDALAAADREGRVLASLNRRPSEHDPVAQIAARAHAAGADIRDAAIFTGPAALAELPRYPWQRESFWLYPTGEAANPQTRPAEHPLLGRREGHDADEWRNHVSLETQPWIGDHQVGGAAVMPAAAMLDAALAAARARAPAATSLELGEVEIGRALVLEPGHTRELRLRIGSEIGEFELTSRPRLSDEAWIVHMRGRILAAAGDRPVVDWPDAGMAVARLDAGALYALAHGLGLDYGPAFRATADVTVFAGDRARATLTATGRHDADFLLAPDLLDGALQGLLALAAGQLGSDSGVMPWRFGRVRLLRREQVPTSAAMRLTRVGPRSVRADVALLDGGGATIAELLDCWFVRVALGGVRDAADALFHTALVPTVLPGTAVPGDDGRLPGPANDGAPDERLLLAEGFAAAAALEAVRPLAAEHVIDRTSLLADRRIAPEAAPLLDGLLAWLVQDGLASEEAPGCWRLVVDDLPQADAILRTLLADAPDAVAEVAALAAAADAIPQRLREGSPPAALPAALRDQLLFASPSAQAAREALTGIVARLLADLPAERPVRVLLFGAGRGAFVGPLLAACAGRTLALTARATNDDLPLLAARLADVAGAQAIAADTPLPDAAFDFAVGFQPIAGGGMRLAELAAIAPALAPGGRVLAADVASSRVWRLLDDAGTTTDQAAWCSALAAAGLAAPDARLLEAGLWPTLLADAEAPVTAAVPLAAGAWSIVAEQHDPLAAALAEALAARGGDATLLDADAWLAGDAPLGDRTVLLLASATADLPRSLSRIAALSGKADPDVRHQIVLVARGAGMGDPAAAALTGAARVLANEAATIDRRSLTVAAELPPAAAAALLVAELLAGDDVPEVVLDRSGRHVMRVRRGPPAAATRAAAPVHLTIGRPGLLDSLGWTAAETGQPGPGEVAIDIAAAALNFRDVMWAMGLLPDEALLDGFAGATLGLECAGVVTAIGEGVDRLAPGDRVMAFAPASLASRTVTAAHAVMRMPAGLDFAGAATVPVAFLTVVYAVGHLARLQPGETILIHGGAGGVGLAAIQYARHRGARIFATAGSAPKRALLRRLGVEAVLDSRSLDFADEVLRLTGGEGVDVVLNSLAGEAMRRSLQLVKPFGRFLELGKRDFYENSAIGLRPFRHNVTYFGIDADQLPLKQPRLAQALFDEIAALFAEGALTPLPYRRYAFTEVEDAFRLMQSSGHIGKIVLEPGTAPPLAAPAPARFAADPAGAYLVSGGLDGFGHEAARWLARHGATKLALLGRRGAATPGAEERLAALAADGVQVRAYACDVADEAALATMLDTARRELGPITGVVHAAVAMDDALLGQLDAARFARALAPKLGGADALDRLTRGDPVSLFLLFSSVTTPLGNPGQANYVAANAAIEAIAERRHAAGLPALAVQWGPVGDAGYLARTQEVSDLLARQLGGQHLTAGQALDALPLLLATGAPVVGLAHVNWSGLRGRLPLLATPLFADLAGAAGEEGGEIDLRALLAACTPDEAQAKATALLVEEVARIMKLGPERIDPARPLTEFGMDSLMAVELRLAVEQRFGVTVPLLALSEGATLSAMAARILRGLGSESSNGVPSAEQAVAERIRKFEGATAGFAGPADRATAPAEPDYAAAAASSP